MEYRDVKAKVVQLIENVCAENKEVNLTGLIHIIEKKYGLGKKTVMDVLGRLEELGDVKLNGKTIINLKWKEPTKEETELTGDEFLEGLKSGVVENETETKNIRDT